MKRDIDTLAKDAVRNHVFPGCVIGIIHADGASEVSAYGRITYEAAAEKVEADTLYDLASITKSIPTASLALQLIDEKRLSLTDAVHAYLPEYQEEDVLVKHLLTYTVHGPQLSVLKHLSAEEIARTVFASSPKNIGTAFEYANAPALLLGFVIERILGKGIDEAARERFFEPLNMRATTFSPEKDAPAPTEIDGWRGEVRGFPHDECAYVFRKAGKTVGHAGLFSTVPDMLLFLGMIVRGGEAHRRRFLSEAAIALMRTNLIPELGSAAAGWELDQPFMGHFRTPHTFGKTGFTGTSCVVDIEKRIAFVILSNRTYPKRPRDRHEIDEFRVNVADAILSAP